MSYEELEQRVHVLEGQMARLNGQENGSAKPPAPEKKEPDYTEDDLLEGVDFDIVLSIPPKEAIPLTGIVVAVERGPVGLSLTDEEWERYGGEDDDD